MKPNLVNSLTSRPFSSSRISSASSVSSALRHYQLHPSSLEKARSRERRVELLQHAPTHERQYLLDRLPRSRLGEQVKNDVLEVGGVDARDVVDRFGEVVHAARRAAREGDDELAK